MDIGATREPNSPRRVTILGSTGSIGTSALDVVRRHPGRFEIAGLSTRVNIERLAEQIAEFRPAAVAVFDETRAARLRVQFPGIRVLQGESGIEELAAQCSDIVLCAMVGAAGLGAVLKAIDAGRTIALANKEPMVIAGTLIMDRARQRGVRVLPVDSEHSAIFQCLEGHATDSVHRVHLTASGGPFYRRSGSLDSISPAEATNHPTWDMGDKISVDSATLMNKGLEVIEAMRLFALPLDKMSVVIHPQSIVHSLVEFVDGGMLAQLGPTDMRIPIQFALTWPDRVESCVQRLDLTAMGALTFDAPDFSRFPCLELALDAAARGGTAPALLNAANEVAVEAFCHERIGFTRIPEVIHHVMSKTQVLDEVGLRAVLDADTEGRRRAREALAVAGARSA